MLSSRGVFTQDLPFSLSLSLPSSRSVSVRDISCCVIPRITTLRGDDWESGRGAVTTFQHDIFIYPYPRIVPKKKKQVKAFFTGVFLRRNNQ